MKVREHTGALSREDMCALLEVVHWKPLRQWVRGN